jgi:parvulin-like peptidyl-prolyl isomerase
MLRFLRTQGKRTKTIWWVLIVVTVVTFLGGFVFILGSGLDSSSRARASGAVGVVDGEAISNVEFQDAVTEQRASFKRNYGGDPGERDLKMLEVQAWRTLVLQRLMNHQARQLGISAGDREVVVSLKTSPPQSVVESPSFQTDGKFDANKYQQAMMDPNNVREVARLEEMTRHQLPTRKLQERLLTSIKFSEAELAEAYRNRFERINAVVLQIPPGDVKPPAPSEADLQRIYEQYKSRFTVGARTQAEVLVVPKQFGEEEIKAANDMAKSLADRARRGEDFASLARDYSEGPGAENGGIIDRVFQLSEFGPEIAPKMATLDTGGIADPIRDGARFLVVKLLERVPAPSGMPGIKVAQIVVRIRGDQEQLREQYSSLNKLRGQARKTGLGKAAAAKGMATSMTPFFDASNTPPELYGTPEAADWAMNAKKGAVSPVFEGIDEFVVVQVASQQAAGPAPKEEISAQLRQLAELEAKVNASKAKADAVAAAVRQGATLESAAGSNGLATHRVDGITRLQPDATIAGAPELIGAMFAARPGQVIGPIHAVNGWYFARVEEKIPADPALLEQVKPQLSNEMLQNRQRQFMNNYLSELRSKAKVRDLRSENPL